MSDARGYTLEALAAKVGGRVRGDPSRVVVAVAGLAEAGKDDLSFLTNPRYRKDAERTGAGAVLVGPGVDLPGRDLLEAKEPYVALAEILEMFHPPRRGRPGVSPRASVGTDVRLGEGIEVGPYAVVGDRSTVGDRTVIGPGVVLGEDVAVGEDTVIHPRAVLYPGTRVGARCRIHAGVVLGADGFGFASGAGGHRKVPQVGRVVVEDDVEIGANTTVDRATLGETVIGRGTKIDDQVMIAHGVRLGPDCLMVAQSGVAGSTEVGAGVTFAGQAGAAGHLRIGDRAVVFAKSAVFKDVPAGARVAGIPAVEQQAWKRSQSIVRKLPGLQSEIRTIREKIEKLESRLRKEG